MSVTITGDKQLDRKLQHLERTAARRAAVAGLRATLTPIADGIRRGVNGATISAGLKRAARQTIGRGVRRYRGAYQAKIGFGVGKQTKARRRKATARHAAGQLGERRGVGISSTNIHWMVLGTAPRTTKSGHPTGHVEPMLEGIVAQGFATAQSAAMVAAQRKIWMEINREAKRR